MLNLRSQQKCTSLLNLYRGKLNPMKTMGERIKWARKQADLSQEQLGKAAGVSKGAVSLWESSQTKNLKNTNLYAVAAATGVRAEWLVSGKGQVQEEKEVNGSVEAQRIAASIMQLSPSQRAAIQALVDTFVDKENISSK